MSITDIQTKLAAFARPEFTFDIDNHEYYLQGRKLLSFSTWIKDFTEPFDELKVAGFSASKRGCTVEEVLAEWKWSRDLGTLTHAFIEAYYKNEGLAGLPMQEHHPEVLLRIQKFMEIRTARLLDLRPLGLEVQVYNEAAGLCGTIDFVAQHAPSGKVYVVDFKTNKALTMNNELGRYTKRMRGALGDLWDTHETKYALQVSYYRLLLEAAGVETAGGVLIHLPPGDAPAKMISCTDYRSRIRSLLF